MLALIDATFSSSFSPRSRPVELPKSVLCKVGWRRGRTLLVSIFHSGRFQSAKYHFSASCKNILLWVSYPRKGESPVTALFTRVLAATPPSKFGSPSKSKRRTLKEVEVYF
uniref:Uncharacterized protein n=1 Tax=Picea glauca TaxID=3330 RepID=A0A117NG86_PICGL|nr:hypothetical protein ABT39_MTgene1514 [Picea glauca]